MTQQTHTLKEYQVTKIALSILFISILILGMGIIILNSIFYTVTPNSPAQIAIGEITGQTCDKTEVVYYRIIIGFLGGEKWIKTTEDKSDISQEECVK